VVWCCYYMAV